VPVSRSLRPDKVRPVLLVELLTGDNHVLAGQPAELVPGARGAAPEPVALTGVTHDSRQVRPGDLYAALPGAKVHGARFASDVVAAGAAAILTDRDGVREAIDAGLPAIVVPDPRAALGSVAARIYGDPSDGLTVVGITGTNGKTTTAYLVEAGLRAAGQVTGVFGTVETRLGDEVLPAIRTTPEAPDLQALLAVARERGVTAVVMEVSSHALAMGRVEGVRFAAGLFTNLGSDHLDFHHTTEEYFAAKAKLFDGRCRFEVVNCDDPAGRRLVKPGTITVSPSGAPGATWRVAAREPAGFAQHFQLDGPDGLSVRGRVGLPAAYNVDNAALAIAALAALGVPPAEAASGVASARPVPGRMERVDAELDGGSPVLAVVDYAHDPHAVAAALGALRPITKGRLICVLGCGGDRDAGKRPLMGEQAALGADVFVATDDNPRSEPPWQIRAEMLAGVAAVPDELRAEIVEVADRRAAVAEAVRRSEPGDTVAVLGKGHEQGQEVSGVVHPFDDRVVLAESLREVYG
jgi:UDP-N-acetylmuramoyl-L-alanyl-D-glutamate--2,6-diaminopimelate ligase